MVLKLRYKPIHSDDSKLITSVVYNKPVALNTTSHNFRFAASVAEFGMLLRKSEHIKEATYADAITLAKNSEGNDDEGYRSECIKMMETAALLQAQEKR